MAIFLKAEWQNIIMANYVVPSELLQPYLPYGTELDLYEDKAYVSLVGFLFKRTRLFSIPIPFFGTFEEVNLRFYVTRREGDTIKRGVVFINETIPYKPVAWMANKLYKEHYTVVPTKHTLTYNDEWKEINYFWKIKDEWQQIGVKANTIPQDMQPRSLAAFIYEHYFGYTKINGQATEEYQINHPSWKINEVIQANIKCDFINMYGNDFSLLQNVAPSSVFIAEGSPVSVDWKRRKIQSNK
jgi:uncharacterized protein